VWRTADLDSVAEVTEELIAEVLAAATGIPVFKLNEEESARLLRMEDELHKRVIGQDDAIRVLAQSIRRTRAGLKDPKRPGGSFIFAGPSGVGKTELSRTLAEFLSPMRTLLIQLDMSEYMVLKDRDMRIELRQEAKHLLAERGYDPIMGARPLRRTIEREIEDRLSEKILRGEVLPGQFVVVDVEGEGDGAIFTFTGASEQGELDSIADLAPVL